MKQSRLIRIPRILTMVYVAFMMLFSLDMFNLDATVGQKWAGFFMHNLPAFLFLLSLVFTWRKPLRTAILLVFCDLFFTLYYGTFVELIPFLMFSVPPLVFAPLFLMAHYTNPQEGMETGTPLPAGNVMSMP